MIYFTGVSRQTLNALEKLGAVAYREQEEYRISEKQYTVKAEELTLNDQQQRVCDTLLAQVRTETPGVTLLRGVTGSGKTVVYIRLAQELLKIGRSVMILVPEDRPDAPDDGAVHRVFRRRRWRCCTAACG